MNPTEDKFGAAENMTNEQQNVTSASQPMNNENEMREEKEERPAEEAKQEPVPPEMTRQQYLDASLDVMIRRNAAAAELENLERRVLAGVESEETLKLNSGQLRARLEALLSEQMRLAKYNQRRH